jgi:hypothetical protein
MRDPALQYPGKPRRQTPGTASYGYFAPLTAQRSSVANKINQREPPRETVRRFGTDLAEKFAEEERRLGKRQP